MPPVKQSRFQGSWPVDVGRAAFLRLRDRVCDGGPLVGSCKEALKRKKYLNELLDSTRPCTLNMNDWNNQ